MPRPRVLQHDHAARYASEVPQTLTADGAVDITYDGTTLISKTSAAAVTIAAPGLNNIGRVKQITTGTDFAHVVTFTGSTLRDGTTGAKITWTAAAFAGSSITIQAISATLWVLLSKNLGVQA